MAAGDKPIVKIFLKSKTGNQFVDLLAGWSGRRPEMNPIDYSVDSSITSITLTKRDGTVQVINPKDFWCNVKNEAAPHATRSKHREVVANDDSADDEIPF